MGHQSKLTAKGQTTIPLAVRRYLKLEPGDRMSFTVEDGKVVLRARNVRGADLAGILDPAPDGRSLTIREMDEALGIALAEDDERIVDDWNRHQRPSPISGGRRP